MKNRNKPKGRTVDVIDGNVQRAIKQFKRMVSSNNILSQYYEKRYYKKPSVKRRQLKSLKKFKIMIYTTNSKQEEY